MQDLTISDCGLISGGSAKGLAAALLIGMVAGGAAANYVISDIGVTGTAGLAVTSYGAVWGMGAGLALYLVASYNHDIIDFFVFTHDERPW